MKINVLLARKDRWLILFIYTSVLLALGGCGFANSITYFDTTTYKNLTEAKPQVALLYESFTGKDVDSISLKATRLRLRQMYEYEKGKGERNSETTAQIRIINDMFERHITDRLQKGPWSSTDMMNKVENISDAFDLAISTEALKNKQK